MTQFNENFNGVINIPLFDTVESFQGILTNKLDAEKLFAGEVNLLVEKTISFKGNISIDVEGIAYGEIEIVGTDVSQFKGNVSNRLDIEFKFEGILDIPLFDNTITYNGMLINRITKDRKFKGIISIPPKNIASGMIDIDAEEFIYYSGNIRNIIAKSPSFPGTFRITPQNTLFGKISLRGMGISNYQGTFISKLEKNPQYDGIVKVPIWEELNKYPGKITNRLDKELSFKGRLSIPPENTMFGKLSLIDTPKNRYYGVIVKDTHTVISQPTNNYGSASSLYMSDVSTVLAQWRFNANKDIYYVPSREIATYFRVYLTKALSADAPIRIYTIPTTWNEYTVNEDSKPPMNLIYTGTVSKNTVGAIEFDLGDLLKSYNKTSVFDVALAIQIDTPVDTASNSRETLINPLGLYYDYHYIPPSIRTRLFKGNVTVRKDKEIKYKGKVKILSDNALTSFKGTFNLPGTEVNNAYPGIVSVFVPKNRISLYEGFTSVPKFDREVSYPGTFINKLERVPQYPAFIKIPVWEQTTNYDGTLTIPTSENEIKYPARVGIKIDVDLAFPGTLINRIDRDDLFEGIINIPRYDVDSLYKGTVTIRLDKEINYDGIIKVPRFDEEITYPGNITVRLDDELNYDGIIKVPRFDIDKNNPGNVYVPHSSFDIHQGIINIPLFEETTLFKGTLTNKVAEEIRFKCSIRIKSDRKKVRIFIM